jgi:hypothetical protein
MIVALLTAIVGIPASAAAQQYKDWEVMVAPLYFWAPAIDGSISTVSRSTSIYVPFDQLADRLGGAFSFHFEGRKGKVGVTSDVNFVRLSSDATYQLPKQTVQGTLQLDTTIFQVAGTYLVARDLNLLGGVRTYSLSPGIAFTVANAPTSFDATRTSVNGIFGFTYRPALAGKINLVSGGDVGGGGAHFTWTGTLGVEYRFKPWGGLLLGYHALGIDTGTPVTTAAGATGDITQITVTEYGPIFALTLHWGK